MTNEETIDSLKSQIKFAREVLTDFFEFIEEDLKNATDIPEVLAHYRSQYELVMSDDPFENHALGYDEKYMRVATEEESKEISKSVLTS